MRTRNMDASFILKFLIWISVCHNVQGIEAPFVSDWALMQLDGTSPVVISHPFSEIPAKVDVQVKVVHEGKDYIFPGLGSAQRDDDLATDYGGVGYLYNDLEVKIYVPVTQTNGNGQGWVILMGGSLYTGPFIGAFTTCSVRVRAWRISDWPTPAFSRTTTISTSASYSDIIHNLGVYPDFVTVQLALSSGYVSEAQGTTPTTLNHGPKWVNTCGTVFGITDSSVKIWGASGADDFVACFKDGWGSEDVSYSSAAVTIRAWVLSSQEIIQTENYIYQKGIAPLVNEVSITSIFNMNSDLVVVQTTDDTSGTTFYGAGSASLGDIAATDPFGGTLYGYNQSHVLLWTPDVSYGYPISVGGVWGSGSNPIQVSSVAITVRVISTGTPLEEICPLPPSIANGYYVVTNHSAVYQCNNGYMANQTNNVIHCNNSLWEHINLSCEVMSCPVPYTIANTIQLSDGIHNGSLTLYSCISGYSSNGGNELVSCNGTHWSDTNLSCTEIIYAPLSCGVPQAIQNAYFELFNNSATYHCHIGFSPNQTNNTVLCVEGRWEPPTLSCMNTSCTYPPDIPNAIWISDGFQNGSSTLYSCVSGFVSNNVYPEITCNGTYWSSTQFNCSEINICGLPPSVPNAYYDVTKNTATYHCHHGFTANDTNNFIRCVNFQWQNIPLSCLSIICVEPPIIPNAVKISDGFHNGSMTLYSCQQGFYANDGHPFTTCNGTHWSNTNFACSDSVLPLEPLGADCGLPPSVPNAYFEANSSLATYYCHHGYKANGTNNTIRCIDSHWTYSALSCLNVTCGDPPAIQNTIKTSNGSQNGSITLYSCLPGYSSNSGYPVITCNGMHWSNTNFSCLEISCPDPPDITNTLKASNGRTNGSVTLYSCLSEFIPNDADPLIECIGNQWTGTNYTCLIEPVPCDSPLSLPNADVFWNVSIAVYTCRAGYKAAGDVHSSACENGFWTSISGVCEAMIGNRRRSSGDFKHITSLRAHGWCDRSAEEAYSSMAPDPAFAFVEGSTTTNTTNSVLTANAFETLRIPKHNTSAYERSLVSAYDPRQSAKAIGSVGAVIIVLTVGLICLSDCVTLCSQRGVPSKDSKS